MRHKIAIGWMIRKTAKRRIFDVVGKKKNDRGDKEPAKMFRTRLGQRWNIEAKGNPRVDDTAGQVLKSEGRPQKKPHPRMSAEERRIEKNRGSLDREGG